jgi:hypothetical protein
VSASESPLPTSRLLSADHVGSRQACSEAAGSGVPVAPWDKTGYEPCVQLTHGLIALLRAFSAKVDGDSALVFDTGATNLFIVVPTLTVPDRWIFS